MPIVYPACLLKKIKAENKGHEAIKSIANLQIPKVLGGCVDLILGIRFANVYPDLVFSLPNGLQIYRSKFLPAKKNEVLWIGGPIGALDFIVNNAGNARASVRYLANLVSKFWKNPPRIEFFPETADEIDVLMEKLVDITWSSTKRLMNVCKKYGSDDSVKEMLIKSMNKLMDNGRVV